VTLTNTHDCMILSYRFRVAAARKRNNALVFIPHCGTIKRLPLLARIVFQYLD
jgi:hypothetical protein